MRIRRSVAVIAAASLSLGSASAALAGPLDDLIGRGPGPSPSQGVVNETLGYVLDLVAVGDNPLESVEIGDVRLPIVAIVNDQYEPLEGPVREHHGVAGHAIFDMVEVADLKLAEFVGVSAERFDRTVEFIDQQCGECTPGLGGPIGPIPVGPVGDEARYEVNRRITTVNDSYARFGNAINAACGNCTPGLGGPIGPIPVGPVGEEDPTA